MSELRGFTGMRREDASHDLVYVAAMRRDWEEVQSDEDALHPNLPPLPASAVPRLGEYFLSEGHWWRVEVVALSAVKSLTDRRLNPHDYIAWVDLVVTLVDGDPRK